ncbi:MAG TPA: nucleotidyltransferase family protein [Stellaceae bacterium]|nr:nucleotidyltransferase family protein [Stellaceae bacterium]
MRAIPETAMVLAAGLGTRMRPISEQLPKPLVQVGGRALIDHVLDRLVGVGVRRVVVNLHYRAEMIERHLAARRDVDLRFSFEPDLLDTGGGVAQALPQLDDVFYVVNSDVIWLDTKLWALARLARAFDPERHDAVLLLQRTAQAVGYSGLGDFMLDPSGNLRRRGEREVAPHLFAGVQLLHCRLFDGAPQGAFSINPLWDKAIAAGRIRGLVHDGEWFHVGSPAGLALTEARLNTHRIER